MIRSLNLVGFIILAFCLFSQPLFSYPYEGSADELAEITNLGDLADHLGFSKTLYDISAESKYHSFSKILQVAVPGKNPEVYSIIIPVSMPSGLTEESYSAQQAYSLSQSLLEHFAQSSPQNTLLLFFVGAQSGLADGFGINYIREENLSQGSRAVLEVNSFVPSKAAKLQLFKARSHIPRWYFSKLLASARASGLALENSSFDFFQKSLFGSYRLDANEIQTWAILGSTNTDSTEVSQDVLFSFIDQIANSPLENLPAYQAQDNNYLALGFNNSYYLIEEIQLVYFVLVSLGFFLLLLFFRKRRKAYLRSFFFGIPSLLFILVLAGAGILIASLALNLLSSETLDLGGLLGRLSFAVAILLFARFCLPRFFQRSGAFYSASALFFHFLLLFWALSYSINLIVPVFICSIPLYISIMLPYRRPKLIFALLHVLSMLVFWTLCFTDLPKEFDRGTLQELLGFSNLALLFSFLPGYFQVYRSLMCIRIHRLPRKTLIAFASTFCLVVLVFSLVLLRSAGLDNPENTEPVRTVFNQGKPSQTDSLSLKQSTQYFLNRKTLHLEISSKEALRDLSLSLKADRNLSVFSCNFPYTYVSNRIVYIFIGKNPPLPLTIELVVPSDTQGDFELRAGFSNAYNELSSSYSYEWNIDDEQ